MAVPTYDHLFNPLLKAIHQLGGSASIEEQERVVAENLRLSDRDIAEIHRGSRTKLSYRLAWARNYLKRYGVLDNSTRGVWSLTEAGLKTQEVDRDAVKQHCFALDRSARPQDTARTQRSEDDPLAWQDELLEIIKAMPADAFERLAQRLLRESGFVHVTVTGKTGDGGIDGRGVVRVGGVLSFHVLFQCKRYKGTVSPSVVRDFRGALMGRADKGVIITTGAFSRDARAEAQRDGATPIDLIDGDELVEKLKELGIGVVVREKKIEEIEIVRDYFRSL